MAEGQAQAQKSTKLPTEDIVLLTVATLPATAVSTAATTARLADFTASMKQSSFRADFQERMDNAVLPGAEAFTKLKMVLRLLRQIEGRDTELFKFLQVEPTEEADASNYEKIHEEQSAKGKAWHAYTTQVANELLKSYPNSLDSPILERKGPIFILMRLLVDLGYSTLEMVAEEIKNEQVELALDVEGGDTFGQLIRSFQERTSILSMLQAYLQGFRSEAPGDTSRWYTDIFSVKTLMNRLTLPDDFKTGLDEYPGDAGETNIAFDAFFGWLRTEATQLDSKQRKRVKQRQTAAADSTFAAHADHDGYDFTEAVRRVKQSSNPGYVGIHCNGKLERKSRGLWHYDGIEVHHQEQIKVYQGTPVWCDRAGKPRICSEIDKSNRLQCTGVHPRAVCPAARKNDRNVHQPNLYHDNRKEHGKKRKAEADPSRKPCRFWSTPTGCRKGHDCRFAHQGKRGQSKRAKKKPQQHQTNGVLSAANLQSIAQAVHALQHPPPTKGDDEGLSTE
jgi:hypothetical protein